MVVIHFNYTSNLFFENFIMPANNLIKHQLVIKNLNFSNTIDSLSSSFSLSAQSGDIIGISGTSGVGKSIFLKGLADLIPHQGFVQLNNQVQNDIAPHQWRKQLMLVPAESQWWHDTVQEHFVAVNEQYLSKLNLNKEILAKPIHQLSTGEKQRLSILRALELQPKVLLLDEVSANLDLQNSMQLEQVIVDYVKEQQAIAIWVSHDSHQLERVATKRLNMTLDGLG